MKKFGFVASMMVLVVALAGCGGAESSSGPASVPTPVAAESAPVSRAESTAPESVSSESLPASSTLPQPESVELSAGDYALSFYIVPEDQVAERVGEANVESITGTFDEQFGEGAMRPLFIRFTGCTKDGEPVYLSEAARDFGIYNLIFTIDGADYFTTFGVADNEKGLFYALPVPASTPPDPEWDVRYEPQG